MKDKAARALAIIALVFMGIFIASFIAALADRTLLGGGITIVAICSGVFTFMVFIALKADGRGFSLTKMKNESELQEIERALKQQSAEDPEGSAGEEKSDGEKKSDNGGADNAESADPPDNTENPS